jgi:hypothetical protein
MRLVRNLFGSRELELLEPTKKDDLMTSKISRTGCLTELTSNPKSFTNCPDLQGGVPGVRGGRSRSGKIHLLDAPSKHKALHKSKRPRGAKNAEEEPSPPAVGTLEPSKRQILAAIRVWELKRGIRG